MAPSRSAWWIGAITRSSEIWIWAGPSAGSSPAHSPRFSTCPPLTATVSPRAMTCFANRPLPWIGLARTSVLGERYVRSSTTSRLLEDREVDLLLGDELEQHRHALAGLGDAALDRVDDLARLGDALAVAAERLGHVRVVAADVRRAVLLGGGLHDRQLDGHREVVEQDREDRDALAHRGLEVHAGEADRRVAPHVDAERVRPRQLGPHREPETVAELGGLPPADVGERVRALPERREL